MSAVKIRFHWVLFLLLVCSLPGYGAERQREPAVLAGLWCGPLKLPGNQLDVMFRLVRLTTGDYFATLDAPLRPVGDLAVTIVMQTDTVFLMLAEANTNFACRLTTDGTQLRGIWQQPGFAGPLTLTRAVPTPPMPRRPPTYREEEVSFSNTSANLRLAGTLTLPAGQSPFPAVVLLSDGGTHDRNGTVGNFSLLGQLADYLTQHGIAVLRFDDRGIGKSGGTAPATMPEQMSDAQAALRYLRTRSEINPDRLGLVGHGEGGNTALLAAAQLVPPAFVVGLAPYGLPGAEVTVQQQVTALRNLKVTPEQIAAAVKRQQAMFEIIRQISDNAQAQAIVANMLKQSNKTLDPAAAQAAAAKMVSAHYRFFLNFDPSKTLPNVACPVLLLYGTSDFTLDADLNANALMKGFRGSRAVTLRKLPGVNHLFQPEPGQWPIIGGEQRPVFSPAAAEAIRAWVAEQASRK